MASHGHFAFFGAYATINIVSFYFAMQQARGNVWIGGGLIDGWCWKTAAVLLNLGVLSMTVALLIAGYEQSFIERAVEDLTWAG